MLSRIAIAGALLALLCLQQVRARLRADIGRLPSLHAELSLLGLHMAFDAALERREKGLTLVIRRRRKQPSAETQTSLNDLRRIYVFIRRRPRCRARARRAIQCDSLALSARVGAGDAAFTALLYGMCQASMLALAARLRAGGTHPTVRVLPDYRQTVFLLGADCIITVRIGDIMAIAWLAVWEGWIDKWNGIRSKA